MLKAVLFDLDGVIIDTERHGHREAFNRAFRKMGVPDAQWDERFYHTLLQIGGGKERAKYYFEQHYQGTWNPSDPDAFIRALHEVKTDIFLKMLVRLPLRPGVLRFMREIRNSGMKIGLCTTSSVRSAETVVREILPEVPFSVVIAGDQVRRKKPAPEIYTTALASLRIEPAECLVVEDSNIGVRAGHAAGCRVLATYNDYTKDEDLSQADCIVSCLGDPDGEKAAVEKEPFPITENGVVTLERIERMF